MRKVLFICYYWPPSGGPGSLRMVNFVKHLPQFGWHPIVLTVKNGEFPFYDDTLLKKIPESIRIVKTKEVNPFFIYKKLARKDTDQPLPVGLLTQKKQGTFQKIAAWIRSNLFIPDARIGWFPFILYYGLKLIKQKKIEVVISSSPPHSLQLATLFLRKISHIPWVVDLRDPWTTIRYYDKINRTTCTKKIDQFMEKRVLTVADHVITVSDSLALHFKKNIKESKQLKFTIIPNGFDEEDFQIVPEKLSSHFQILHTGNLLENQNPVVLWQSLSELLHENADFQNHLQIYFIGRTHPTILYAIKDYGLSQYFKSDPFMPHHTIIKKIKRCTILLVVIPQTNDNAGIVTGKLYEYIGSQQPILLIGPSYGDAAKSLRKISSGYVCDYGDIRSCKKTIRSNYRFWKAKKRVQVSEKEIASYSRHCLTERLSGVLNRITHHE